MIKIFWYKDSRLLERECKRKIRQQITEKTLRQQIGLATDAALTISRHDKGKPYLPDYPSFHFNQSDSGEWMAIGTSDSEIGIDIEKIKPRPYQDLLNRWFLPDERKSVEEIETRIPGKALAEFIRLWTCKESILKYIGCGLGADLPLYPVLSAIDGKSGNRIPYGYHDGRRLAFYNRILPQHGSGCKSIAYDPLHACMEDIILSLCYQTEAYLTEIQEVFLPETFLDA